MPQPSRSTRTDFPELTARGQVRRLRRLGLEALRAWDVQPARVILLQYYRNATFRVDGNDGRRYVLRLKRIDAADDAWGHLEFQWLRALHAAGRFDVPLPLPSGAGEEDGATIEVEGAPHRYRCSLLSWIYGRRAGRHPGAGLPGQAGELMARLHRHAETWRPTGLTDRWSVDGLLGPAMGLDGAQGLAALSRRDRDVIAEVATRTREVMRRLGKDPGQYGIIHGDLHLGNCLFNAGQAGAIDFETCGGGLYAYDIAVMLATHYGSENREALRESFLRGYCHVRPLQPEELAGLTILMCARIMGHVVWQASLQHEPAFGERARERVRMQVAWLERMLDASASTRGR